MHLSESLRRFRLLTDLILFQFEQGLGLGQSNELHKLCGVAGDIFQLLTSHFSSEAATRRLEFPEICELLGVKQQNPKYPTFTPLLFANKQVNMRTPFSNWQLLASVCSSFMYFLIIALTYNRSRSDPSHRALGPNCPHAHCHLPSRGKVERITLECECLHPRMPRMGSSHGTSKYFLYYICLLTM